MKPNSPPRKLIASLALALAFVGCSPVNASSDAFCIGVAKMAEYAQIKRLVGFTDAQTAADLGFRGDHSAADQVVFVVTRFVYDSTPETALPSTVRIKALVQCRAQYTPEERT